MKLKLDLHPIYNDAQSIERSLQAIIDEAVAKRVDEIEIIPGKGSGALKKTVLRFLDRSDVKARYHRLEKDSDNFGRLFVHFKHRIESESRPASRLELIIKVNCFCCDALIVLNRDRAAFEENGGWQGRVDCPSCGSPNSVSAIQQRSGRIAATAESGYE